MGRSLREVIGENPEFEAYRAAGNKGWWDWETNRPADESNSTPQELELMAALEKLPPLSAYET